MNEQANQQSQAPMSDAQAQAMVEDLLGLWQAGGTMGDALGISSREAEALYSHGHSLYAQGKYEEAFRIFARLVALEHLEDRYQMALACALQMTKRYETALEHFAIVTVMRLDDPLPVYHSAECFLALGRLLEAAQSLELVANTLCQPGKHDAIKARAQAMLQALAARGVQANQNQE